MRLSREVMDWVGEVAELRLFRFRDLYITGYQHHPATHIREITDQSANPPFLFPSFYKTLDALIALRLQPPNNDTHLTLSVILFDDGLMLIDDKCNRFEKCCQVGDIEQRGRRCSVHLVSEENHTANMRALHTPRLLRSTSKRSLSLDERHHEISIYAQPLFFGANHGE